MRVLSYFRVRVRVRVNSQDKGEREGEGVMRVFCQGSVRNEDS